MMDVLVALSRYYGGDPEYVLAGGGNTSAKTEDRLWVKASGFALATIGTEGFVEMDRGALSALVASELPSEPNAREAAFKDAIYAARLHPSKGQRPSVECVLHHLMPGTFVVHSHSTYVNMVTCSTRGEALTKELFGVDVLWVPYVDPGYVLAIALGKALAEYKEKTGRAAPKAVFMQNHGLIVAGDTPDEVLERTDFVVEKIRRRVAPLWTGRTFGTVMKMESERARKLINVIAPALRGLLATSVGLPIVTFDDSDVMTTLAAGVEGAEYASGGPLTPDQIVYCKAFPTWFEPAGDDSPKQIVAALAKAIEEHKAKTRFAPKVVIVKGLGLFAAGDDIAAADTVALVYADAIKVMAGARKLSGVHFMTERERDFIEGWEVENYRRSVAAASAARGKAAGKVAFVTGAAQGFGLEIAKDFVKEGAHVALADINLDGVRAAAESISSGASPRAIGIAVDVTRGESVADAIHEAVRRFGGFDIFVSNAGVLRAGSVKTIDQKEFEFVTAVNYKGYFNCVQNAAPILATEHLAKRDYTSDIIQINSKSGLVGSNRNGAYAGSKFGGVGLTQSFALELIEDGIKVNAICPGNFFEGPLWSDPQNGLFAQYLRSGKVPGAKTIEDVKRAYEAKVPMGRGCTAVDVMKAVYYLVEQQYETGQALPVTGGQVMLG